MAIQPSFAHETADEETAHQQAAHLKTFGRTSSYVQCPHCLRFVHTNISISSGKLSLSIGTCGVILMIMKPVVLGALFIGFNVWFVQNTLHKCPECSAKIATYKPLTRRAEIHSIMEKPIVATINVS